MSKLKTGMTLTEVVIAVCLAVISIAGVLALLTQNADLGQRLDYSYASTGIAKSRIEKLREIRRDMGYDALADIEEENIPVDDTGTPDPDGNFIRSTTVDPGFGTDLTQVTVTVQYKKQGIITPFLVELTSLISRYD